MKGNINARPVPVFIEKVYMKIILEPVKGINLYSNAKPYENKGCVVIDQAYIVMVFNLLRSKGKIECRRLTYLPYEDALSEVFTAMAKSESTFIIDHSSRIVFTDITPEEIRHYISKLKNVWIPKEWNINAK